MGDRPFDPLFGPWYGVNLKCFQFSLVSCRLKTGIKWSAVIFLPSFSNCPSGLTIKFVNFLSYGDNLRATKLFILPLKGLCNPVLCTNSTKKGMWISGTTWNTIYDFYFFPLSILRLPVGSHTCQTKEERVLWSTFCSGKEAAGHEKSSFTDE